MALVDVLARLHAAAEAAQAVQQAMLQRTGSGTGDILRANFAVLVRTVCEQDAHLLVPEETDLLQQFQVGVLDFLGKPVASLCSKDSECSAT